MIIARQLTQEVEAAKNSQSSPHLINATRDCERIELSVPYSNTVPYSVMNFAYVLLLLFCRNSHNRLRQESVSIQRIFSLHQRKLN